MIRFIRNLYRYIHIKMCLLYGNILGLFFSNTKIDKYRIMYFTFQFDYTCNPKYICEYIRNEYPEYKHVWVVNGINNHIPEDFIKVKFGSFKYYYHLYKSGILIDNAFNYHKLPFKKKQGQLFIQTMHSSLGIKKMAVKSNETSAHLKRALSSASDTDYITANSDFISKVFRMTYWKNVNQLLIGHARTDIFYTAKKDEIKAKIYKFYNVPPNDKLVLYAPTFSDNSSFDTIDKKLLLDALNKKFNANFHLIFRSHPRDIEQIKFDDTILNGNLIVDIQELMVAIDFAITDYSSWIWDYIELQRPGLLYCPDLKKYSKTTGFYYNIKDTPFPLAETNEQMIEKIINFDSDRFAEKVNLFIKDKGCVDDGNASKRLIEYIKTLQL